MRIRDSRPGNRLDDRDALVRKLDLEAVRSVIQSKFHFMDSRFTN
jgi:hypothetical protein